MLFLKIHVKDQKSQNPMKKGGGDANIQHDFLHVHLFLPDKL